MKHILYTLFALMAILNVHAQQFTPMVDGPLVNTTGDSRSINIVDVNGDGLEDIYITNGLKNGQNNELYLNLGNNNFQKTVDDPIVLDNAPSDGATCADTDNDGDLDCFMVTWYNKRNYFYQNNGLGNFTHSPDAITGVLGTYSETASFADYDKDGLVDIYITNSEGDKRNLLYRNTGNNNFTKITATWLDESKLSRAAVWADYDNDGDQDLYVANENESTNSLFRNENGSNNFVKVTNDPSVQESQSSMTASWGDVNNDGFQDLFVGNAGYFQTQNNRLFINNGNGGFTAAPNGPINTDNGCSYGSGFADYDNDGDLDLLVSNGFCNAPIVNFLYENDGNGQFSRNLNALSDFTTPCSFGMAWGDLDNNGFQDIVISTCKNMNTSPEPNNLVFMNNGNDNHWLKIKLVGTTSNRAAIGAQIMLTAQINGQTVTQMREISAQTGYCGQSSLIAHFGLGNATSIGNITVKWPSGLEQVWGNVNLNTTVLIIEGSPTIGENSPAAQNIFSVKVNPNPILDTVHWILETAQPLENISFTLVDMHGKILRKQDLDRVDAGQTQYKWDVTDIPAGLYLLKTTSAQWGESVIMIYKTR